MGITETKVHIYMIEGNMELQATGPGACVECGFIGTCVFFDANRPDSVALCRDHAIELIMKIPGPKVQEKPIAPGRYNHQNKGSYFVLPPGPCGAAIDCTNGVNDGRRMVVYRSDDADGQLYVREESQFAELGRFERRE